MFVMIFGGVRIHKDLVTNILPRGLPRWLSSKESACNAGATGATGLIPELRRSPGGGHGNPLQYSCLENPMDRGACQTTVHRVEKSWTWLKQLRMQVAHTTENLLSRSFNYLPHMNILFKFDSPLFIFLLFSPFFPLSFPSFLLSILNLSNFK